MGRAESAHADVCISSGACATYHFLLNAGICLSPFYPPNGLKKTADYGCTSATTCNQAKEAQNNYN
jgi:hypothetical protein